MGGKSRVRQLAEQDIREAVSIAVSGVQGRYIKAFDRRANGYALLGHTNEEIAELLGVDASTFDRWIVENPSLALALRKARNDAYVGLVRSMHRAGNGYTLRDRRTKTNAKGEVIEIIDQKRHIPPNVNAAALILTNRQGDRWKDRKSVEHTGTVSLAALVEGLHAGQPGDDAKVIEATPEPDSEG